MFVNQSRSFSKLHSTKLTLPESACNTSASFVESREQRACFSKSKVYPYTKDWKGERRNATETRERWKSIVRSLEVAEKFSWLIYAKTRVSDFLSLHLFLILFSDSSLSRFGSYRQPLAQALRLRRGCSNPLASRFYLSTAAALDVFTREPTFRRSTSQRYDFFVCCLGEARAKSESSSNLLPLKKFGQLLLILAILLVLLPKEKCLCAQFLPFAKTRRASLFARPPFSRPVLASIRCSFRSVDETLREVLLDVPILFELHFAKYWIWNDITHATELIAINCIFKPQESVRVIYFLTTYEKNY